MSNNILDLRELLRGSCPEVFYKKYVLRNFAKFTGKHLYQSLFFDKVAGLMIQYWLHVKKIMQVLYYNDLSLKISYDSSMDGFNVGYY